MRSLSINRILVKISSVERPIISSGISSQVSSAGLSGVVSIAASWAADAGAADEDKPLSGLLELELGGFGGCDEDMAGECGRRRRGDVQRARRLRV